MAAGSQRARPRDTRRSPLLTCNVLRLRPPGTRPADHLQRLAYGGELASRAGLLLVNSHLTAIPLHGRSPPDRVARFFLPPARNFLPRGWTLGRAGGVTEPFTGQQFL